MMITLKEARDIKSHLILSELWTEDLISRLKNCIKDYRLDIEIPQFGQRRNLRRTYTCPFYKGTSLGCQLPPEVKPYGCLAFNPKTINARGESGQCESNQALLEQQMTLSIESQDLELKDENIKLPIPMALLRWD